MAENSGIEHLKDVSLGSVVDLQSQIFSLGNQVWHLSVFQRWPSSSLKGETTGGNNKENFFFYLSEFKIYVSKNKLIKKNEYGITAFRFKLLGLWLTGCSNGFSESRTNTNKNKKQKEHLRWENASLLRSRGGLQISLILIKYTLGWGYNYEIWRWAGVRGLGCLRVHAQPSKLTAGPAICRGRTFQRGLKLCPRYQLEAALHLQLGWQDSHQLI